MIAETGPRPPNNVGGPEPLTSRLNDVEKQIGELAALAGSVRARLLGAWPEAGQAETAKDVRNDAHSAVGYINAQAETLRGHLRALDQGL